MAIVNIAFYILIGLWFINVRFQYQEIIIGILALIIGIEALLSYINARR